MRSTWLLAVCVLVVVIAEIGESIGVPLEQTLPEELHANGGKALLIRIRRGGFGYKNKSATTTTQKPQWKPKVSGRIALAKQKNIDPANIPADDEEFKNVWPDDYYDDYDFEHKRNMIQHGTFEGKIQKYHEQELAEAQAETAAGRSNAGAGPVKPQTDNDQM